MLQVEFADVAAQQDFVVDVIQRLDIGIRGLQNLFEAKFVERAEPDAFGALADGFHHAVLHLPGGFIGERKPQDVFAGELGIRFEQDCGCAR